MYRGSNSFYKGEDKIICIDEDGDPITERNGAFFEHTLLNISENISNKFSIGDHVKNVNIHSRRYGKEAEVIGFGNFTVKSALNSRDSYTADTVVKYREYENDSQFGRFGFGNSSNYELVEDVEELTVEEISKRLGKTVKIVK